MDTKNKLVAAVDIGTTKIVTIVGRKNDKGKIEILGLSKSASKGVKRGVVLNIDETVEAIRQTVEEVEKQSGNKLTDVYVGIAGQHIRSTRNRGYINRSSYEDEITKEDVQTLLEDVRRTPVEIGEEIIHVIPQNYIVDNETGVKNPVGMSGKRLEANFHIVIGKVASAKNISKCIDRVGLRVNELILEPLASSSAVLTEDEMEAGVALVDIGGGTTDVAVFYDDIIRHTAVIPFGGNVITYDIKEGCSILQRQAEALKLQFGSALGDIAQDDKVVTIPGISGREPKEISFKNLAYIIQSRMEEIIDTVMFELENSGYADKLGAGIVLTGGGALLKNLPQLVKFKTGYDVRLGLPSEHISSEIESNINHPMYSTSVGLILKGLEQEKENKPKPNDIEIEDIHQETKEEEIDEVQHSETQKQRPKQKVKFIESIKNTFNTIFDEEDNDHLMN